MLAAGKFHSAKQRTILLQGNMDGDLVCRMRVSHALNIDDLRQCARSRLPRAVFEFIDRGAEDEWALKDNLAAFAGIKIWPRHFRDVSRRTLATELFGVVRQTPFIAAPTGSAGLVWPDGEIALAQACAEHGIPFSAANFSLQSLEAVATVANGSPWFQVYIWPDRDITNRLVDRADAAGCETLVVTIDTPAPANREYNRRNGFVHPYRATRRNFLDMASHPGWLWSVVLRHWLSQGAPSFANFSTTELEAMRASASGFRLADDVTWTDLERIRKRWPRKLIVKGILNPDDAKETVRLGADGIVVSNHGGRTEASFPAAIDALPGIATAVGDQATVLVDGGIRRGSDVFKALALGAKGVLLGRSLLYGLASGGQAGAQQAIDLLKEELLRTMAFAGTADIESISDSGRP